MMPGGGNYTELNRELKIVKAEEQTLLALREIVKTQLYNLQLEEDTLRQTVQLEKQKKGAINKEPSQTFNYQNACDYNDVICQPTVIYSHTPLPNGNEHTSHKIYICDDNSEDITVTDDSATYSNSTAAESIVENSHDVSFTQTSDQRYHLNTHSHNQFNILKDHQYFFTGGTDMQQQEVFSHGDEEDYMVMSASTNYDVTTVSSLPSVQNEEPPMPHLSLNDLDPFCNLSSTSLSLKQEEEEEDSETE